MKKDLSALRIDQEKKGRQQGGRLKIVFPFAVLIVALVAILYYFDLGRSGFLDAAEPVAADNAAGVNPEGSPEAGSSGREVLIASGYVVAHHRISLGSKVIGRVEWIGVDKGDKVKKGDLLVKLDDREFRARVRQAKAELDEARARLAEMEAGSRPEEIQRSEAELARAKADRDFLKLEWERARGLLTDSGVVSQAEVDNARAAYERAQAALRVAEENLTLSRLGPRIERIAQTRAQVARAEANLEYAEVLLDATEIRAPVSGTILQRIAELGEMITTSFAGDQGAKSAVVALADLDDLQVELDISQSDFQKISHDQDCKMSPEAYADRVYECEIAEIAPEADRQKATIQIKVQILEPDEYLRPDMDARVTFLRPDEK